MAESSRTFSESWHRVANQRICLRLRVEVQRHHFRGERWMVLQDPLSNQFFRLRPEAYEFVARLRPDKTVEQVWQECLELFPKTAPGQEAVVNLLAQLYHGGLLHYELAPDTEQLFERYRKRKQAELGFRWLNIMFMRFPLLDPDRFLVRTLPLIGKLISPFGALLWLVVFSLGVKVVLDNFPALKDQSQGVLAPDNLAWLYLGMVIVKTLHEFGHAYFCRFFGGEVHQMGVMLMIFTPVPFMDATSSWGFRKKRHRILVGLAGMIVEFFVAACAAMVWARTAPGILHSVAFNIMFVASVSTLLFNVNPLMRFDGYYILSDWLEIPNLNQRSSGQLRYLAERFLLGVKAAQSQAHSLVEAWWLVVFGISAFIYRTMVFAGIVWFIADKWLLLGMAMAAACVIAWLFAPLIRLTKYLVSSPKLVRNRARAAAVVACCAAVIIGFLQFVPLPYYFRASGVLQAKQWSQLITEADGEVAEILATPGQSVTAGQPLMRLENQELISRAAEARAMYDEVEARWRAAVQRDSASLKPLVARRESAQLLIERLENERKNLIVRARHAGVWVAPGVEDFRQRWLKRGTPLGLVVNPKTFEFTATVLQEDVDRIFRSRFSSAEVPSAEIRLTGQVGEVLRVNDKLRVVPGEQRMLPSPALGWMAGGDVATSAHDKEGRTAQEPFFSVSGQVTASEKAALLHGHTGKIRFRLDDQPLLPRWIRRLSQLLQKRFQF